MSSTRYYLERVHIITNGSMTGTSTITSTEINTKNLQQLGITLNWSGTPNGTFVIQAPVDGTNYQNITTSPATISASGSAGSHAISIQNWPYPSIRVQYTNSSSTGTLNAYIVGKSE